VAVPKTVVLRQKGYPADIDLTPESLHNLGYPIDWDGLLDYVGRPAILKPYSGGGWKHVYKVENKADLIAAYDGTAPYCMTLQQFIHFDQYVRCFTFGKTDITPVAYDPHQRRYLVDHSYLSAELGARIVRDAQTLNNALGYEMNTIEFAVQDGVLQIRAEILHLVRDAIDDDLVAGRLPHFRAGQRQELRRDPMRRAELVHAVDERRRE